ncbi:DUF4124 domain-containing protein [Marinobacter orientalis]|uniref:DUF4124 domain-containing protein n=1 Tax=Marinobacter orientalis TaxID=1928859 RepID=A0A7Y0RFK2_9GAMM|nr:DUF4124 domain-containing protein [Marinobacter orientalis]NMT65315.1 DUF4124 domain-containing protein [Marinobacter orientalis]TGX47916.1 DUF4124 domain-containing protein [Marinobacter orientalis]
MKPRLSFVAGILVFTAFPLSAEVYRQVDAQGNVTYTDEPTQGTEAEVVDVKPVTTVTLPKPEAVREPERLREQVEQEGAAYESVTFVAPDDEEAFYSGSGDVEFQVTSSPSLRDNHKYEVTLDGQPVGQSQSGTVMVRNVYRGTHEAGVNIIDSNGVTIKSGETISFTVHRPSVLN